MNINKSKEQSQVSNDYKGELFHHFTNKDIMKYGFNEAMLRSLIIRMTHAMAFRNEPSPEGLQWCEKDGKHYLRIPPRVLESCFPFLHKRTINRAIASLKEQGELETVNLNAYKIDQTNWYYIKGAFNG